MMEIAISLAIIGIALVSIIGVLPIGMNVQQANRQETTIDQDASVFMEAIRNGTLGVDDLTNYVYAITNNWVEFESADAGGAPIASGVNGYTYSTWSIHPFSGSYYTIYGGALTNGANIVGLMSTPEFTDANGDFTDANGNPVTWAYNFDNPVYSNHVVAYCYSLSGPAMEKPPQDNPLVREDSFGYRVFCVNSPIPENTNNITFYDQELAGSLHELRLSFEWPQLPNGALGPVRQTFRTLVAGQLQRQPPYTYGGVYYNSNFYYYVPQWFTNSP